MVAPLPNSHAVVEPWFQSLLAMKRAKGLHPHAKIRCHRLPLRTLAEAIFQVYEDYVDLPTPRKPAVLVVVPNDYQQGFWTPGD